VDNFARSPISGRIEWVERLRLRNLNVVLGKKTPKGAQPDREVDVLRQITGYPPRPNRVQFRSDNANDVSVSIK
jgi:hypothetical protein